MQTLNKGYVDAVRSFDRQSKDSGPNSVGEASQSTGNSKYDSVKLMLHEA